MSAEEPTPMELEQPPVAPPRKNAEADPRLKSIRIKTGSVKRLAKDLHYYEKEHAVNVAKIDEMKAEGE